MLVSKDRAEKALIYMAETDQEFGTLKADLERNQYICKRTRAAMFLSQDSGSVEQKKAISETSVEVRAAEDTRTVVLEMYEKIAAKRKTEHLIPIPCITIPTPISRRPSPISYALS